MSKPTVLIIDDDVSYLEILAEGLEDKFTIKCASTLALADDLLKENIHFDIALVDENIGTDKGSEWIKLKKQHNQPVTSFVLYSGLATEEAVLKGLECGADDFLAKPISLLGLNKKLERLIDYQAQIHGFEDELKSKDNVINISMAQASKYGSCMQLTSKLNSCISFEEIRDDVFNYFRSMNLEGCIAFYPLSAPPLFYSSKKGLCSPVETEVMELLKVKSRLYRFGSRTIFNHPLVSILILNLEDGTIDTDIFIDALASVIECVGARIEFITYKNSLIEVQEQIQNAVVSTKKMVEISKHHQQEVMNEIVQNIGLSFHILDLSEEQENHLMKLVHDALKKHSQDDINFLEVTSLLDATLQSVDRLKNLNSRTHEVHEDFDDEDELF
jgi:DNA-binding NarL/FixJ family response regulator